MDREGCQCECLKIPGVCFDPSDEELVTYYLTEKIEGRPLQCNHLMTELQIYDDDLMPWEVLKDDNPYWMTSSSDSLNKTKKTIYVFTELRKKKSRVIRRSGRGSWTGQNNPVVKDKAGKKIGYNKLLTFYEDSDDKKGKKGKKKINNDSDHGHWIMHEYSLFGNDKFVLCKIVKEVRIGAKALVPDMICGKNGQTAGACTGSDGAANDSCGGVYEIQDFMTADGPRVEAVKANNKADDDDMEGNKENLDDLWNLQLDHDVSPTDTAWVDDLFELWPVEDQGQEHEVANMICGKNGQTDGACTGSDGVDNDSSSGVHEIQDFITADAPCIEAVKANNKADDNIEGNQQILDDFWNLGLDLDVSATDRAWEGLDDLILDFSSPDLSDLWPVEESQGQAGP
ncbi:NAC domain-containing protein JA2-like [Daucus carota subsp. sativus]|uniref:NAC domain-containing protein JA2-like n=1 Tax=Daucus carota subsp. sativus TaxID=79200 RepID=UPI0007F036DE|nr:PREDICTED: NAC domain-containing protein 71-like [Daucus carota subsp. sativus]